MLAEKTNQTVNTENELIHRLFVENYSSMCRTAYFALGDYGLAETAVQETFVIALRFLEKLSSCENPIGWLYKAMNYTIKHIQRDRNQLLIHTVPLDELSEQEATHIDEYSLLDDKLKASDEMKLLIEFYYMGYSIREIAERMGISVGACKMRLKRAREKIRNNME